MIETPQESGNRAKSLIMLQTNWEMVAIGKRKSRERDMTRSVRRFFV